MNKTPKGVLQLTRWRWWMLAACLLNIFSVAVGLQAHTVTHDPLLAPWLRIFGCVGICAYTAMIWYAHLYWKRQVP